MCSEHVLIDRRFNGPRDSGHGGYVCGLVAAFIPGPAEVTLRTPPPLDRPLAVERLEGGDVSLLDGEVVVAEGGPAEVEVELSADHARRSHERLAVVSPGPSDAFPACFGCGTQRAEGDGLGIFPGPVPGRDIVAAPWTPHPSLADVAYLRPEFVWAALDDAGAWAFYLQDRSNWPLLLGRLAARLLAPVQAGEPHVVIGWPRGREGRKFYSGTALLAGDGSLRAFARATWVRVA